MWFPFKNCLMTLFDTLIIWPICCYSGHVLHLALLCEWVTFMLSSVLFSLSSDLFLSHFHFNHISLPLSVCLVCFSCEWRDRDWVLEWESAAYTVMLQNTAAFTALTCFCPYFSSCLHRMAWFTNSLSMTVLNEWFTNVEFLTQLIWDHCNKYNHWCIGLWPPWAALMSSGGSFSFFSFFPLSSVWFSFLPFQECHSNCHLFFSGICV